jgi:hypothetical protein
MHVEGGCRRLDAVGGASVALGAGFPAEGVSHWDVPVRCSSRRPLRISYRPICIPSATA